MKKYLVPLVCATLAAMPAAGRAEEEAAPIAPAFNLEEVAAICSASVEDCEALIAQILAELGAMPGIDLSVQLGLLASALLQTIPPGSSDAMVASYGELLEVVASASPDPQQAAAISFVAQAIIVGGIDAVAQVPQGAVALPPRSAASPA